MSPDAPSPDMNAQRSHNGRVSRILWRIGVFLIVAILVLGPYGVAYFAITYALKVSEATQVIKRGLRVVGVRR